MAADAAPVPYDEVPAATIRAERPALSEVDVQCPHCTSHRAYAVELLADYAGARMPCWACVRMFTLPHPPTTEGAA